MLIEETGQPELIARLEHDLLRKGFKRVPETTPGDAIKSKEYTRRDLPWKLTGPKASVVLTWRE